MEGKQCTTEFIYKVKITVRSHRWLYYIMKEGKLLHEVDGRPRALNEDDQRGRDIFLKVLRIEILPLENSK